MTASATVPVIEPSSVHLEILSSVEMLWQYALALYSTLSYIAAVEPISIFQSFSVYSTHASMTSCSYQPSNPNSAIP